MLISVYIFLLLLLQESSSSIRDVLMLKTNNRCHLTGVIEERLRNIIRLSFSDTIDVMRDSNASALSIEFNNIRYENRITELGLTNFINSNLIKNPTVYLDPNFPLKSRTHGRILLLCPIDKDTDFCEVMKRRFGESFRSNPSYGIVFKQLSIDSLRGIRSLARKDSLVRRIVSKLKSEDTDKPPIDFNSTLVKEATVLMNQIQVLSEIMHDRNHSNLNIFVTVSLHPTNAIGSPFSVHPGVDIEIVDIDMLKKFKSLDQFVEVETKRLEAHQQKITYYERFDRDIYLKLRDCSDCHAIVMLQSNLLYKHRENLKLFEKSVEEMIDRAIVSGKSDSALLLITTNIFFIKADIFSRSSLPLLSYLSLDFPLEGRYLQLGVSPSTFLSSRELAFPLPFPLAENLLKWSFLSEKQNPKKKRYFCDLVHCPSCRVKKAPGD